MCNLGGEKQAGAAMLTEPISLVVSRQIAKGGGRAPGWNVYGSVYSNS
jgi:hypothetical protein